MNNNTAGTITAYPDTRRGRRRSRRARHMANITAYPATRSAAIVVLPMYSNHTLAPHLSQNSSHGEKQLQPTH
ncbi:MAG: hypothetical protein WBG36_13710 [Ornithinimicrobium sp.]